MATTTNDGMWVKDKRIYKFIPYRGITHIVHSNGFSEIRMGRQLVKKVCMPLGSLEQRIPCQTFFRTHRNYIVNKYFIHHYDPEGKTLCVEAGETIPVSRRKRRLFMHFINNLNEHFYGTNC